MNKLLLLPGLIAIMFLTGCSSGPPKCDDPEVTKLVIKILSQHPAFDFWMGITINKSTKLTNFMEYKNPTPTTRYCEAIIGKNGKAIKYEASLTSNGNIYVFIPSPRSQGN